jgi:hypothetical protein
MPKMVKESKFQATNETAQHAPERPPSFFSKGRKRHARFDSFLGTKIHLTQLFDPRNAKFWKGYPQMLKRLACLKFPFMQWPIVPIVPPKNLIN